MDATVSRMELFLLLKNEKFFKLSSPKCNQFLISYVVNKFGINVSSKIMEKQLRTAVKLFVSKFIYKWKKSRKFDDRFLKQNAEWLKGLLRLPHQTNVTLDQEKVTVKGEGPKQSLSKVLKEQNSEK